MLHHGDRQWNAPTRLQGAYLDATPTAYRLVSRRPPDAPPATTVEIRLEGRAEGIERRIEEGRLSVLRVPVASADGHR